MSGVTLLDQLDIPASLNSRILCRVVPTPVESYPATTSTTSSSSSSKCDLSQDVQTNASTNTSSTKNLFILYLPTVVLRKRHNPSFALSCRLANHYEVPLIIVSTVLDDHHMSRTPLSPVCMTARRLAFTLEALACCTREWEDHGAGVAIRVHGSKNSRTPHHLTLAQQSVAVVCDEPFVEPYRVYVRRVVNTCRAANVPCFTVDGSTTVPPNKLLKLSTKNHGTAASTASTNHGELEFTGAPAKAWIWEKQTNPYRKSEVIGALKHGYLDAPNLIYKLPKNFFCSDDVTPLVTTESSVTQTTIPPERFVELMEKIPSRWKDSNSPSPGMRPWTVQELCDIKDLKKWAESTSPSSTTIYSGGIDCTVRPCQQTDGSYMAGRTRWKRFCDGGGLKDYAKRRNQIVSPHAVSRLSCYLNLGILSIFDVVHDVWQAQSTRAGYSGGCQKFLEELVKWREIGYVHCFATPNYHKVQILPKWARRYLDQQLEQASGDDTQYRRGYDYKDLETAKTGDQTWDAMQRYLIETGELHNNARMTWGKTVVHWQVSAQNNTAAVRDLDDVLWQLCCLNDRFALDGLSPPSYAGILWCFGWCDKPGAGGTLKVKWAHSYRTGPSGFENAKENLLKPDLPSHNAFTKVSGDNENNSTRACTTRTESSNKRQRREESTLDKYFAVVKKK